MKRKCSGRTLGRKALQGTFLSRKMFTGYMASSEVDMNAAHLQKGI